MGMLDFLKRPKLDHPRFGEMTYVRGYWEVKADYLGYREVELRFLRSKEGVDEQALAFCAELEKRYPLLTEEIGEVLFTESYKPIRADPPGNPRDVPRIKSAEDVWSHANLIGVEFGVSFDKNIIELAFGAEWEVEHNLGIGVKDWRFEYFNGSV